MWRILLVITGVIMSFQLIGGDTSNTSAIVNQVNQNIAQLKVQDVTNIFKDDTGTRRVLLGKGKNDFYGMKVSQAGTDVYDGADEDMVFNSDNNLFKIVASGTATETLTNASNTVSAGTQVITVAHNLGYKPVHFVYIEGPATFESGRLFQLPYSSSVNVAGEHFYFCRVYSSVDNDNLYIRLQHNYSTDYSPNEPTFTVKYYILQETAN